MITVFIMYLVSVCRSPYGDYQLPRKLEAWGYFIWKPSNRRQKTLQDLRKVGNYNLQKALSLFVHVEPTSDASSLLLCNFA